jgi:hypothetical protein
VLVASLLEAISINPAIVVVPGHAFIGWETWADSGEWRYLETTMIATADFDEACASADETADHYDEIYQQTGDRSRFRRWSVAELRSARRITPME